MRWAFPNCQKILVGRNLNRFKNKKRKNIMSKAVIFLGWTRPMPGREQKGVQYFQEFLGYLTGLQESGDIDSFEVVILEPHGGDLNGFCLLRGDSEKISAVQRSDEYIAHITRSSLLLEGLGSIRGITGERVTEWMGLFGDVISKL
jgi:hypothetical protein